jgi:hypothetical protein
MGAIFIHKIIQTYGLKKTTKLLDFAKMPQFQDVILTTHEGLSKKIVHSFLDGHAPHVQRP